MLLLREQRGDRQALYDAWSANEKNVLSGWVCTTQNDSGNVAWARTLILHVNANDSSTYSSFQIKKRRHGRSYLPLAMKASDLVFCWEAILTLLRNSHRNYLRW